MMPAAGGEFFVSLIASAGFAVGWSALLDASGAGARLRFEGAPCESGLRRNGRSNQMGGYYGEKQGITFGSR
jgi:hypothetical protein